jgi:hypothetical protein
VVTPPEKPSKLVEPAGRRLTEYERWPWTREVTTSICPFGGGRHDTVPE